MSKVTPTSKRKADHIRISLEEDVQSGLTTGLERLFFTHNAAPELDLSEIDLSTTFLGKPLSSPLLISSMTGGTEEAAAINLVLAEAAQSKGIAMGLGSQRAAIEDAELEHTYQIREVAPDILLFANLGAVQLNYGYGIDEFRRAVKMVEADALILHFNALQEALQPEGDTNFDGLLKKIEDLCTKLDVPVIAKEVGWGISAPVAKKMVNAGVQVIDVAGAGGTSWSQVEMHRALDPLQAQRAADFVEWGIPTAIAIADVHHALPDIPLIASGGLRNGIDAAKCIALGADLCGMAGPFLKAAAQSTQAVLEWISHVTLELKICMFATGCADLNALRQVELETRP
ncbi:MAG: type 2 isopentenyl-diphosphate Delta-isomerase [Anaerolineales bacterium]|nr:type 2 isopentenyl-diphosphate Delta-isomerase [Anaerolineales bacterium]